MKKVYRIISTLLIAAMVASSLSVMAAPNGVEQMEEFSETSVETSDESMSDESSEVLKTSVETPAEPTPDEPNQDDTTPDIVDGIIQIDDEQDLNKIGNHANYPLDGDYILTADITMTENSHPIGKDGAPFIGTFDGDGHVIYNLTIEEEGDNVGFFGVVSEGATIKNLGIESGIVKSSGSKVGGLVGWAAEATIEKCYYTGKVSSGAVYVGGLIGCSGFTGAFTSSFIIKNCYHVGNVEGKNSVGGIIGFMINDYGTFSYEHLTLENCYHVGNTYCNDGNDNGGIIGTIYNDYDLYNDYEKEIGIKNCYYNKDLYYNYDNEINPVGNSNYFDRILRGLTTTEMTDYRQFYVMAGLEKEYVAPIEQIFEEEQLYYYPQLSVFMDNNITLEEYYKLSDDNKKQYILQFPCFTNEGTVVIFDVEDLESINSTSLDKAYILMRDIDLKDKKFEPIGSEDKPFTGTFDGNGHTIYGLNVDTGDYAGLFGCVGSKENVEVNSGTIKNLKVEGNVVGNNYVGGIVGHLNIESTVENCSFDGHVSGKNDVGGIVGRQGEPMPAFDPYNTESGDAFVRNCCHIGRVTGKKNVGGISGLLAKGYKDGLFESDTEMRNCYHSGLIYYKDYGGGLIGYFDVSIITAEDVNINVDKLCYSYYNNQNSGKVGENQAIGGCSADDFNCNDPASYCYNPALSKGDHPERHFQGLTNKQMSGNEAITNMTGLTIQTNDKIALPPAYTAAPIQTSTNDNGDILSYYPQLSIFVTDANDFTQFPSWNSYITGIPIETADELNSIGNTTVYPLYADYILMNDINMSDVEKVEIIGNDLIPFTGTFDGKGHTITGYKAIVNKNSTANDLNIRSVGLFSCVENGTIRNLKVEGIIGGNFNVGGIAGSLYNSTIENCAFIGDVEGKDLYENNIEFKQAECIGGLVGYCDSSKIINCYTNGRVYGDADVGGIVGWLARESTIENCASIGDVSGGDELGGIAGRQGDLGSGKSGGNAFIRKCYHVGSVSGNEYVGGISGKVVNAYGDGDSGLDPEIGNCYHSGAIQYEDNGGGLIGYFENHTIIENNGDKTDCNLYNSFYDNQNCGAKGENLAIGGCYGDDEDSAYTDATKGDHPEWKFIGLRTEEMTGPNALNNMTGIEGYTAAPIQSEKTEKKEYKEYVKYYYPQLSIFVTDANDPAQFPTQIIEKDMIPEIVDGVIQIDSSKQLQAIGNVVTYPLDGKYAMTADIDMSEVENFTPIGSEDEPFIGTFDGNGHTIYGLNVKNKKYTNYAGLFGCVENGTVKNLKVEGSVKGVDYIGGIAGKISDDSVIENCNFNGQIYGEDCIGSIAGYVDSSSITNCSSVCDIKANDDGGGIAGKVVGTNNTIKGCYHTGSIECTKGDDDDHKDNIGGVIGYLKDKDFEDNNISNCYYDINTAGEGAKNKYGNNNSIGVDSKCVEENGDFDDSNVKGLTTEQMTGPNALGNMPGLEEAYTAAPIQTSTNDNGDILYYYPQLSIFVNDANDFTQFPAYILLEIVDGVIQIDSPQELQTIGNSEDYPLDGNYLMTADIDMSEAGVSKPIGSQDEPFTGTFDGGTHVIYNLKVENEVENTGLFGYVSGEIKNLGVENGTVTSSQGKYVGGLAGTVCEGIIDNCYYVGNVNGNDNVVGGIVGCLGGSDMKPSTVRNCYQIGNVSGYSSVAGIAGSASGGTTDIENCYHSGKLECYNGTKCGGIATYNSKYLDTKYKFKNNYYDVSTSGEYVNNSYDNTNIKGLTTDQMTGPNALNNMPGLEEAYTAPAIQKYGSDVYYPQLTTFVKQANNISEFPSMFITE